MPIDLTICCLQEIHFKYKDTCRLNVNVWSKIYHTNTNEKKAGIAIMILDRTDFKARKFIRNKEGHCIVIKGSILLEDITVLPTEMPNNRASKYVREKLIKL